MNDKTIPTALVGFAIAAIAATARPVAALPPARSVRPA